MLLYVRSVPVWTDARDRPEAAVRLGGPTGRPRRAAAPLSPKALSHEEAPCPPRPPPLHEAPRPRARDRAPPGTRAHGAGDGGTAAPDPAARGPLATAAGTRPRPGERRAALTSGNAMGPVWPCRADGLAGQPAGKRRARTWALFLQRAARSPAPRQLMKLRAAPRSRPPAGCGAPVSAPPGPSPPPPRAPPLLAGRAKEGSAAHPEPGGDCRHCWPQLPPGGPET
ncbi:basic proline-rich protein-like [Pongo abelii]|uniref:basic proline-rich protein-like n=1 Tax=Pongo abelii TaxID=9601 RepID=UPI0023E8A237|nr:basic proline-rich protein-like [Pongo abelii]